MLERREMPIDVSVLVRCLQRVHSGNGWAVWEQCWRSVRHRAVCVRAEITFLRTLFSAMREEQKMWTDWHTCFCLWYLQRVHSGSMWVVQGRRCRFVRRYVVCAGDEVDMLRTLLAMRNTDRFAIVDVFAFFDFSVKALFLGHMWRDVVHPIFNMIWRWSSAVWGTLSMQALLFCLFLFCVVCVVAFNFTHFYEVKKMSLSTLCCVTLDYKVQTSIYGKSRTSLHSTGSLAQDT